MGDIEITLGGCAPSPLGSYLKALGILRTVAEQADDKAKGYWRNGAYALQSQLDEKGLMEFFLNRYVPSPVVAPWNGGSGFYEKDSKEALETIAISEASRFSEYRRTIEIAKNLVKDSSKTSGDEKEILLQRCRAVLPDEAVEWMDAALVLSSDGARYPPLLGTGGNDGRLEFTQNFMQRVLDIIGPDGNSKDGAAEWLENSLFGVTCPALLKNVAIGQFNPFGSGGANSGTGFESPSLVNPWDYILMIEGALMFASGLTRKLESPEPGSLVFPFCVRPSGVGYGSASQEDETSSRAEMWVPLWGSPAECGDLKNLFSEGRCQVQKRRARNGLDFARAVATLGIDRGIDEFQRYSFAERNGRAYFAVPIGRFKVRRNPQVDLLDQIDTWLSVFKERASSDQVPASIKRTRVNLDSAIMQMCTEEGPIPVQKVLIALGECEKALGKSLAWSVKNNVRPIPFLHQDWLDRSNDGSAEFRLAASLAFTGAVFKQNDGKKVIASIRKDVEPVDISFGRAVYMAQWDENGKAPSDAHALALINDLFVTRINLNEQFRVELFEDRSSCPAGLNDISLFVSGALDDERIIELFRGLVLINPMMRQRYLAPRDGVGDYPGATYSLMRLCFPTAQPDDSTKIPLVPEIHRLARAGNMSRATELAARRLRGSEKTPMVSAVEMDKTLSNRIAASLAFPISARGMEIIDMRTILKNDEEAKE